MGTGGSLDWLYVAIGWALAGLGAAVVLWALLWDRSRGRRRCPRCWYDMAGVPGLVCPECGRAARSEAKLARTRRRWRWAWAAGVIALAGLVTGSVPAYRDGGWVRLVPTTVLVVCAPAERATPATPSPRWTMVMVDTPEGSSYQAVAVPPPPPSPTSPLEKRLRDEVWRRLHAGHIASWQGQWFLDRYFRDHPAERPDAMVQVPARWPRLTPFPVRGPGKGGGLVLEALIPGGRWTIVSDVGAYGRGRWFHDLAPGQPESEGLDLKLRLTAQGSAVYRCRMRLPTAITGDMSTFLERLHSPEHDGLVRAALRPRLLWLNDTLVVKFQDRTDASEGIDFGVYFTAELLSNDEVVASGRGNGDWSVHPWTEIGVTLRPATGVDLRRLTPPFRLRIRSDPERAGEAFVSQPFSRPRAACWTGEFITDVPSIDDGHAIHRTPDTSGEDAPALPPG